MSFEMTTLQFERSVEAPVSEVFRAFTNATSLREWLCDIASVDPEPGGRFYAAWISGFYTSGEYLALEPEKMVSFTWNGRGHAGPTRVKVLLAGEDRETQVRLEHSGIGEGEAWAATRTEIEKGWRSGLENLASVLKTGGDLRFTRRPMMGISWGEFNAVEAEKLGVPVQEGIRLEGLIEEMGAYAAGLRSGHVIVAMDGRPATNFSSLTAILQAHQAGDRIEVVYFEGPEQKTTLMELSRRPLPAVPASPQALAELVRQRYAGQDAQLASILERVTEEQASHKPGPEEWCIKEILAHLILGERFNGYWIEELEFSNERWGEDWSGNSHPHTAAVVSATPTLAGLVDALHRAEAETVATLAALPESFMQKKGSFWRLAYTLLQPDTHLGAHIEQIQALLGASKG